MEPGSEAAEYHPAIGDIVVREGNHKYRNGPKATPDIIGEVSLITGNEVFLRQDNGMPACVALSTIRPASQEERDIAGY